MFYGMWAHLFGLWFIKSLKPHSTRDATLV